MKSCQYSIFINDQQQLFNDLGTDWCRRPISLFFSHSHILFSYQFSQFSFIFSPLTFCPYMYNLVLSMAYPLWYGLLLIFFRFIFFFSFIVCCLDTTSKNYFTLIKSSVFRNEHGTVNRRTGRTGTLWIKMDNAKTDEFSMAKFVSGQIELT